MLSIKSREYESNPRNLCMQVFEPWMKNSEVRKQEGLRKPVSLVEACEILGDSKNLQDNAEAKLKVDSVCKKST